MRYLINMTYNGNMFYGYQIQKNKITVEGEIEKVLSKILNTKINTIGSSRTDKGVHAINQYCHFDYSSNLDLKKLKNSMNKMLNDGIYIKKIKRVKDDFHARFNVTSKEYIYKINMGEFNPIEKDYCLQYNKQIDKELINKFVNLMSGKHNFRSFTSDKDKSDYERDLILEYRISNKILYLKFKSSGFLRYMIRNIVGLLLDINDNKKSLDDIKYIFDCKSRCSLGKCASGCGLYLNKVLY